MWRLLKFVPINNSMGEILVAMFVVEDKSLFQASLSIGLPIQVYVRHLGWEAVYIKALTLTRVMQLKFCTVLLKCQGLMLFKCSIWWFNWVMLRCLLLHINANETLIVDRKFSSAKYALTYCAAIEKVCKAEQLYSAGVGILYCLNGGNIHYTLRKCELGVFFFSYMFSNCLLRGLIRQNFCVFR